MKKLLFAFFLLVFGGFYSCAKEEAACEDECSKDEKKCEDNAFLTCGNYDDDTCLEWSKKTPCAEGETCQNGVCIPPCFDECKTSGEKACEGNSIKECGNFDDDACLEWSSLTPCPAGQSCVNGVCTSECQNECPQKDQKECVGENTYKLCGEYDGDVCFEWSTVLTCEGEKVCMNGECVEKCKDECEKGEKQCVGDKYQECGNYDVDPCLEWSDAKECKEGYSCSNGECTPTCKDECSKDGERICADNGYKTCGYFDSDPCLDLSSVLPCAANEKCEDGKCVLVCEDECKTGEGKCISETEKVICGQYDNDPCLEWSKGIKCDSGLKCVDAKCVLACTDDCSPKGKKECVDDLSFKECGNFDDDPCLEWSEAQACGILEKCKDGICSPEVCENECALEGEKKCNETNDGYFVCGNYDEDPCLEWGDLQKCGIDEKCVDGLCMIVTCIDECASGEKKCKDNITTLKCGNYDPDECLEWGGEKKCADGEVCVNGSCMPECVDECKSGEKKCSGDGKGVLSCGNYDDDKCLEFGDLKPCAEGETCSKGVCSKECKDECKINEKKCFGNGYAVCGQFDTDLCLDWSSIIPCASWEKCVDGNCIPTCKNECELGSKKCVGEKTYKICGNFDPDPCIEFGEYLFECKAEELCHEGECIPIKPQIELKISEIYYNGPGADESSVFLEIAGEKNASLNHFSIRGINGADGKSYTKFSLKGQKIGDDGLFLIVHPKAKLELSGVADMKTEKVDFQNSPDSVQILWGDKVVVDAIGYGFGNDYTNFSGEGISSEDTKEGKSLHRNEFLVDTDNNFKDFLVSLPTPDEVYKGAWEKEYMLDEKKYGKGGYFPDSFIDENDNIHIAFMGELFEIFYTTKGEEAWNVEEVSKGVYTSKPEIGINMDNKVAIAYEEAGLLNVAGKDILVGLSIVNAKRNNTGWEKKKVYEVAEGEYYIWYYSSIRYFPEIEFLFFGNMNLEFFILDLLTDPPSASKIFNDFNGIYDIAKDKNSNFHIVYLSSDEKEPLKYIKYDWLEGKIIDQSTIEPLAESTVEAKIFVSDEGKIFVCWTLNSDIEKTPIGLYKGKSKIKCAKKIDFGWEMSEIIDGKGEVFKDLSIFIRKSEEKDILSISAGEFNKSAVLFFEFDGTPNIKKEFVDFGGFLTPQTSLSVDKNNKFHIFFKSINPAKGLIHAEK